MTTTASSRSEVSRAEGLWPPSPGIVRGALLGGIATAAGMALTATSGWLIVRAAERPVILTLLTAIVAVRTFGIIRPVFRYWERLVSHDAALAELAERRTTAYAGLIPLTPARLGRRRRADVLTGVVDDLSDLVDAQVRVTVPVIASLVAGALAIGLTTWLAPPVGLVLTALALVITLVCWLALRLESRSLDELLAARAELTRVSELVTSQANELRAVAGWDRALCWLEDAQATVARATRRQSLGRASASAAFLVAVGASVVATAAIVLPMDERAPVKALLLLTPVAVSEAIAPLTDAMRALARARGSAARIAALLGLKPATTGRHGGEGLTDRVPHILLRGVTASWDGTRTHVGPVDLDLPAGSRVALTGDNGTGKSTLLAVLARHLDPSAGSYTWDGADVLDVPIDDVRGRIALVDDEPHVFATTLRHNLLVAAPSASDVELEEALARAGLAALVAELPAGLDTMLGAAGRHLDSPTALAVLTDLMKAEQGDETRTILMVTHRPEGLSLFERVVSLEANRE